MSRFFCRLNRFALQDSKHKKQAAALLIQRSYRKYREVRVPMRLKVSVSVFVCVRV